MPPTQRQRIRAVHVPRECCRCRLRLTTAQLSNGWAVSDGDGHVTAVICSPCMTPEEMATAIIMETTMECALNIRDGRVLVRTKKFPTDELGL
jgi:hypothetical protein